jgi:predicted transcriptional regulator
MIDKLIRKDYKSLIFEFRGYKVMVDFDLSKLYGVETKRLKEQVKRNINRFPRDFMFELTLEEKEQLIAICERLAILKHSSVCPIVFTEQGVAMLSSVLRSERAIIINIEIMRAFSNYRALLYENDELRKEIKNLDKKLNEAFRYLLDRIDELHQKKNERKPIGYRNYQNNNKESE